MTESASYRIDSEDADRIEYMTIGESEGLLIVKGDFTGITWYVGSTLLDVYGFLSIPVLQSKPVCVILIISTKGFNKKEAFP